MTLLAPLTALPAYQTETVRACEAPLDDGALLGGLCELLARLDGTREALEAAGFEPTPRRGLELTTEFVERLVAFGDDWFDAKDYPERLVETLRECYSLAARLRETVGRGSFWDRKRAAAIDPFRELIVELLDLVCELTFLYFEFFTSRFADRKLSREWVESAAVFCVDLYRAWKSFKLTGKQ